MKSPKISTHAERQDNQIYESNTLEILAKNKREGEARKGKGGGNPGQGTSGKLLAPRARTSEGEEGGSKRPTLLPSLGGGGSLPGCGARKKMREP
jgi:hypothetical protein